MAGEDENQEDKKKNAGKRFLDWIGTKLSGAGNSFLSTIANGFNKFMGMFGGGADFIKNLIGNSILGRLFGFARETGGEQGAQMLTAFAKSQGMDIEAPAATEDSKAERERIATETARIDLQLKQRQLAQGSGTPPTPSQNAGNNTPEGPTIPPMGNHFDASKGAPIQPPAGQAEGGLLLPMKPVPSHPKV